MINWQRDPGSADPLHLQLERQIKQYIRSEAWRPGDRIPSEREFMQLTGLSRATIRQALTSLVHQNVLEKVHGSGTYVAQPKYEQPLRTVYSFSEQFGLLGQTLRDTILTQTVVRADGILANRLAVPPESEVIVIERLRVLNERPMMINKAYVPLALCPALAEEPITGSLYDLLAHRYKIPITRATDTLEAISTDKYVANQLGIRAGSPLMYVERTAYTSNNQLLHLGENYIRADMCRFSINLQSTQVSVLELKTVTEA